MPGAYRARVRIFSVSVLFPFREGDTHHTPHTHTHTHTQRQQRQRQQQATTVINHPKSNNKGHCTARPLCIMFVGLCLSRSSQGSRWPLSHRRHRHIHNHGSWSRIDDQSCLLPYHTGVPLPRTRVRTHPSMHLNVNMYG